MTKDYDKTILGNELTQGLRKALEKGMTPEELGVRLGRIIDTIAGDLADERRKARLQEQLGR